MKRLISSNDQTMPRKIKSHWRILTKNRKNINYTEYKTWCSFRAPKYPYLAESMVHDRLLGASTALKVTYHAFNLLADAFRDKDHESFFTLLHQLSETLDEEFRLKL